MKTKYTLCQWEVPITKLSSKGWQACCFDIQTILLCKEESVCQNILCYSDDLSGVLDQEVFPQGSNWSINPYNLAFTRIIIHLNNNQ